MITEEEIFETKRMLPRGGFRGEVRFSTLVLVDEEIGNFIAIILFLLYLFNDE